MPLYFFCINIAIFDYFNLLFLIVTSISGVFGHGVGFVGKYPSVFLALLPVC